VDVSSEAARDRNTLLGALLARVALGDARSFEELYRQSGAHLYAVALRIVRDRPIAEEILQEAFVNVWHHAGSYDAARSQPLTWLTSVVRNRALDHVRRREVDTTTLTRDDDGDDVDFPAEGPTPVEMLEKAVEGRAIRDCVESLDPATRQAIALAFFQGLSHGELAAHLREPLGTVKSWIRRGLAKLRRCLDAAGAAP
jgi:RNA polymerase sigma-70 factor (ECF subfamily)